MPGSEVSVRLLPLLRHFILKGSGKTVCALNYFVFVSEKNNVQRNCC